MRQTYLYQDIAEAVRREILEGKLKPGDRLPPVRHLTLRWGCTPGTVQRAYRELALEGLVVSRRGQGTRVAGKAPDAGAAAAETPLRRAELVHRAEAFLLQGLTAGYAPEEIEQSVTAALDRWRSAPEPAMPALRNVLRFAGSHDLAVDWLASHFGEVSPGCRLELRFTGSLGGLIALVEGKAELAGCHLWDEETGTYNLPFVRRLLPGRRVALITLAERRLGLILPPGNPWEVHGLRDLTRGGVRFANRQPGSGTRVWLDAQLKRHGIPPDRIDGYEDAESTHSAVARRIAEGSANAGLGLEAAAAAFGLDFVALTAEPYQLVVPAAAMERGPLRQLTRWLKGRAARTALGVLPGYDTRSTGALSWAA